LADRVQALATASPAIERGHWGALFVRLDSGEVLFSRNADSLFVPASNAKLLSTAAVLARLGPDHRFRTALTAATAPSNGTLAGDLTLRGGGDPTLGGLEIPYRHESHSGDRLGPLAAIVESAWQAGLRRVEGDIVGDDTRYEWVPYGEGWAQDDTLFGYGAPVSALTIHDNLFLIRVTGTAAGETARLELDPPLPYFTIDNRAQTVPPQPGTRLHLDRRPGSRHIEVWGDVAEGRTRTLEVAVEDPAAYAAFALRHLLIRRGIVVRGGYRARHRLAGRDAASEPAGVVLAERVSPPLIEAMRVVNKVSHNLWAESALREASRTLGNGTGDTSLIAGFLAEAGVPESDFRLQDASGLSRLSLVSPAGMIRLLRHMDAQPDRERWRSLMPVGGEDGTLETRFRNGARGRIWAKTGTLTGTGSLSGYALNAAGEPIVFSVLVNNVNANTSGIRDFIDRLVLLFVE
jgi:D-alanyl-D-alanine carboxypeptidase/D-alanyl-D-alanine-endopeptidase (penicillin-binding protein 4)